MASKPVPTPANSAFPPLEKGGQGGFNPGMPVILVWNPSQPLFSKGGSGLRVAA